ncbi:MAG: sigma-54 dependent transcriptional regulator [Polyangiales bacterium]|nr:sigma-54-dependent Fis family transcriptional regulator [Myxococcales bacterium]
MDATPEPESQATFAARHDLRGLVYQSAAMHDVACLAVAVAPSDAPVLITGPNGAGKERIADIVHHNSARRGGPFVRVNAGALPEDLLEAELFGAEAGAFTGALRARVGRFEAAHRGTLFLDELGNLSLAGQMKLLRVLETGEYERLGSSTTRRCDVRVVSATNADLDVAVATGAFREDLLYRLNVIELRLPSLAERTDDILVLTDHLLQALRMQHGAVELGPGARHALLRHRWPGNVRELQNRLRRASLVCRGGVIVASDLGLPADDGRDLRVRRTERGATPIATNGPERKVVELALQRASGVVSRAAADLGMSRQALYRRMERTGLRVERRVSE